MTSRRIENFGVIQVTDPIRKSSKELSPKVIRLEQQRPASVSQRSFRTKSISGLRTSIPIAEKQSNYVDQLEEIIVQKNAELEKLQHLNTFLEQALKKREEVAKAYFEENTRLKEALKLKDKQISVLKAHTAPKSKESLLTANTTFKMSTGSKFFKDSFYPNMTKKQSQCSIVKSSSHSRANSYFINELPTNELTLLDRKGEGVSLGSQRQNSRQLSRNYAEDFERSISKEKGKIDIRQKQVYTARAVTVTESQGRKEFESMFLGIYGRVSVLDMENEDIEKVLADPRLLELEGMLSDGDSFKEIVNNLVGQNLIGLMDMFKSIINDFKHLLNIIWSLKKLLVATSSISVSLVLNDALERISSETCSILNCDKANVYIIEESTQELWTKAAKGSNSIIRIPYNSGVAGYVATSGKPLKIDEAYLDNRFNKEAESQGSYRTKTVLAVPIKDPSQRIIGVCEAINKHMNIFTPDDEAVFRLLANQAGTMLKNSIQFDKDIINQQRLSRLLKVGIDMFDANTLSNLIYKAENGLKEIMFTDKAVIFLVDQTTNSFYRFNEYGEKNYFSYETGIIGLVAKSGDVLDISDPYNHSNFNSEVDIETKVPILCLPVKSTKEENKILAVMQVLNFKALGRPGQSRKKNVVENETIQLFQTQVAVCIEQFIRKKTLNLEKIKTQAILSLMKKDKKENEDPQDLKH